MEYWSERDHLGSMSQTQQTRLANQSGRDGEVQTTPRQHDQLQPTSRQHNPASPINTTPTTRRRTGVNATSMLVVEVKEAIVARYHRHSNKDSARRVNEMMTSTPRLHDPVNSTNTPPKTTAPYQLELKTTQFVRGTLLQTIESQTQLDQLYQDLAKRKRNFHS